VAERDRIGVSTATLVVIAGLLVLLLWFVAANFAEVELRLFVVHARVRLAWALLVAASIGFVLGWAVGRLRARR
jgi:uncharacterized integral membrane protein